MNVLGDAFGTGIVQHLSRDDLLRSAPLHEDKIDDHHEEMTNGNDEMMMTKIV